MTLPNTTGGRSPFNCLSLRSFSSSSSAAPAGRTPPSSASTDHTSTSASSASSDDLRNNASNALRNDTDAIRWFFAELPLVSTRRQIHDELERVLVHNTTLGWSDKHQRPNEFPGCEWVPANRSTAGTVQPCAPRAPPPIPMEAAAAETYSLVYGRCEASEPVSAVVRPRGHSLFVIDGVPHAEDVYRFGTMEFPVNLSKGTHELLFLVVYDSLTVNFTQPKKSEGLHLRTHCLETDSIVPDILTGVSGTYWASMTVLSTSWIVEPHIIETSLDGQAVVSTELSIASLPRSYGFARVNFQFRTDERGRPKATGPHKRSLSVTLRSKKTQNVVDRVKLTIREINHFQNRKCTFLSEIDDSVQEYSLLPAFQSTLAVKPAIFLTCHGAGVEVTGQTAAYAQKSWGHVVAPSNRGKYGFDWEDVGLLDAIEVLDHVKKTIDFDPCRIYLTGHSMGGHGTWHIGSTRPGLFAAIAPCAGWLSYQTYAERKPEPPVPHPFRQVIERANGLGDPMLTIHNLGHIGIFVAHGGDDNVVPPSHSKNIVKHLKNLGHTDIRYMEDPGVGHWYTDSFDDGGARCLDKAELFDFFGRRARPPPNTALKIDFTTLCPSYSSTFEWACVYTQYDSMRPSRIICELFPNKRHVTMIIKNCRIVKLSLLPVIGEGKLCISISDQILDCVVSSGLFLVHAGGQWMVDDKSPNVLLKSPFRSGPLKAELRNRFVCVYPTRGSSEEVKWCLAKAKLDREQLFYRGRATVPLVSDVEFMADTDGQYKDRTLVLYGNASTNCAWDDVVGQRCPIRVERDIIRFGGQTIKTGPSVAVLAVYPRKQTEQASCILIGGTGPTGLRLLQRQPLFQPFVRYPDYTILEAGKETGNDPSTIKAAGFFDSEWQLPPGTECNFC